MPAYAAYPNTLCSSVEKEKEMHSGSRQVGRFGADPSLHHRVKYMSCFKTRLPEKRKIVTYCLYWLLLKKCPGASQF